LRASCWDIATKYRLGKLPEAEPLMGDFAAKLRALGFIFIPMSVDHACLAGSFTMTHKDPFDRLIAAQAKLEDLPPLSDDPVFDAFPIRRIW
jgi:PIN domain nuclease of toxin-antitoxin system